MLRHRGALHGGGLAPHRMENDGMGYRTSNEEKQAELNARLSGRYIVRNGEFIGILKNVTVVAPPSGFNTEYSVEMYGNVFYHTTRISDFIPVTAEELINRFGDDVLKLHVRGGEL